LAARDIHRNKQLKKGQRILDHMGSAELAANLFRTTQTEEKIKRENIKGKADFKRKGKPFVKKQFTYWYRLHPPDESSS